MLTQFCLFLRPAESNMLPGSGTRPSAHGSAGRPEQNLAVEPVQDAAVLRLWFLWTGSEVQMAAGKFWKNRGTGSALLDHRVLTCRFSPARFVRTITGGGPFPAQQEPIGSFR